MNKFFILFFVSIFFISCKKNTSKLTSVDQDVVQDYIALFTEAERDSLTHKIITYESTSTNEICVYVVDTIPVGMNTLAYATHVADKLGVGKTDKDNGLLILIAKRNRKISFATGLETEKIMTEPICHDIIQSTIIPNFRDDEYYCGVSRALDSIISKW